MATGEETKRIDPGAIVWAIALVFGTAYALALIFQLTGDMHEALADLFRAGLITCIVIGVIRSWLSRLAQMIQECTDAYSAGYVDGLARRPPAVPADSRVLHSVN